MKKINFKAILILVLAFILVFALVACNDDGGEETPPPQPAEYTPAEYFTNLWDLTSDMGSEAIAESDDLALHADLALDLSLQFAGKIRQNVSVGLGLDVVLDRTSADSRNSALKIQAYDPDNGENWFAGYFFFNDPSNIYLDMAGKNIAIPFDYKNDTYAGSLHKLIFEDVVMGDSTKVNDIINSLTKGMGENWSLNNLIDAVTKLMGVDLEELLADPSIQETIGTFLEGVELFDENGVINLDDLLTSQTVTSILFNADATKKTVQGDVTTYSTQVNMTTIGGLLGNLNLPEINSLIKSNTEIKLSHAEKNGEFDHFTLSAVFPHIQAKDIKGNPSQLGVALTINGLEFRKANAAQNTFGIDRTDYSSEVAFEEELAVTIDGITLNPSALDANVGIAPIELNDTTIAVGIKGKVDLKNKENNGTVANAWIRVGNKHVVDASFKDGNLGVKIDQSVKIGEVGVMDIIVKACGEQAVNGIKGLFEKNGWDPTDVDNFADDFFAKNDDNTINYKAMNPEFKGAVWENLDIVGGFQGMVDGIINMIMSKINPAPTPDAGQDGGQTVAEQNIVDKIISTIQKAMPLFDTSDNKLAIKSNDIFAKVVEIGKIYNSDFTVDTVIDAIIKADTSKMLEKFAKFFVIEGIEQGDKADDVFAKDFLKAIFNKAKGELSIDLSDEGYDIEISITANQNVTVEIESHFGAEDYASADYIDVASEARDASDNVNVGWIVYVMPAQEQPQA